MRVRRLEKSKHFTYFNSTTSSKSQRNKAANEQTLANMKMYVFPRDFLNIQFSNVKHEPMKWWIHWYILGDKKGGQQGTGKIAVIWFQFCNFASGQLRTILLCFLEFSLFRCEEFMFLASEMWSVWKSNTKCGGKEKLWKLRKLSIQSFFASLFYCLNFAI